jgi:hypothetical protein
LHFIVVFTHVTFTLLHLVATFAPCALMLTSCLLSPLHLATTFVYVVAFVGVVAFVLCTLLLLLHLLLPSCMLPSCLVVTFAPCALPCYFRCLLPPPPHPFIASLFCCYLRALLPFALCLNRYSFPNFLCKWRSLEQSTSLSQG